MNTTNEYMDEVIAAHTAYLNTYQQIASLPVDDEYLTKMSMLYDTLKHQNLVLQTKLQSALTLVKEMGKTLRKKRY